MIHDAEFRIIRKELNAMYIFIGRDRANNCFAMFSAPALVYLYIYGVHILETAASGDPMGPMVN
jgi:hypothetical protein